MLRVIIIFFLLSFLTNLGVAQSNGERKRVGIDDFENANGNTADAIKVTNIVLNVFSKNNRFEVIDIGSRGKVDAEKEKQKEIIYIDGKIVDQNQNQGAEILVTGTINSLGAEYSSGSNGNPGSYSGYFNITLKMLDVVRNTMVASEVITQSGRTNVGTGISPKQIFRDLTDFSGGTITGSSEIEAVNNALSNKLPKYINEFIRTYFPLELEVYEVIPDGKKYLLRVAGGEELGIQDNTRMEVFYKEAREVNGQVKYLEKVLGEIKMEKIAGDFIEFRVLKDVGEQIFQLFNKGDVKLLVREKP